MLARCFSLFAVCAIVVAHGVFTSTPPRMYYLNIGGMTTWNSSQDLAPNVVNGEVALLTTWFGVYPCIGCGPGGPAQWCNGGIPQLANLSLHEATIAKDLDAMNIPLNFSGFFVNDYEAWVPAWEFTSVLYRNASFMYAQSRFPNATAAQLWATAQQEWESSAIEFLVVTINAIKKARPHARGYGYYGYPATYSYWGFNDTLVIDANNKLMALWSAVTAFYPSLYLPYMSDVDEPLVMNENYLLEKLNETHRIAQIFAAKGAKKTVLPYTWYRYHPGEPHADQIIDELDTWLEFDFPFQNPLNANNSQSPVIDGVIVWGSEANQTDVAATKAYFAKEKSYFVGPIPPQPPAPTSAQKKLKKSPPTGPPQNEEVRSLLSIDHFAAPPPWTRCGL